MITDVPNSSVALAVARLAKDKNKAFVNSSMGVEFTVSPDCNGSPALPVLTWAGWRAMGT